jgi:type VI secretion system protein
MVPCRAVRTFVFLFAASAGVAMLSSCSMKQKVRSAFGGELPMHVVVVPEANEDSPVAVDVVVVYDRKLVDDLLKLSASQWFATKAQFMADHDRKVAVQGWEWVPGQKVDPISIEYRAGAQQVVVFADYHTDGAHRVVVQPQQPFRLVLEERDLVLEKNP